MKNSIKNFLRKRDLYYPLKYSRIFRVYEGLFKPGELRKKRSEIAFYKSFLSPCNLVFDIGAYDGHKTEAFLKLSKKVVCCEPDEENFKILKTRFRNDRRVTVENKAVSDVEGVSAFFIHHDASAFNTLSERWVSILEQDDLSTWKEKICFTGKRSVETTTLDRLIAKYGVPDFIKIDVEGYEQWVLKGLSQPVPCIAFEILLPEYSHELDNCLAQMERLSPGSTYNIASHEHLLLERFVKRKELDTYLSDPAYHRGLEIIVKMVDHSR